MEKPYQPTGLCISHSAWSVLRKREKKRCYLPRVDCVDYLWVGFNHPCFLLP